jgi:predicted porin
VGKQVVVVLLGALVCASRMAFAQGEMPSSPGSVQLSQGAIQLYGRVDMDIERVSAMGSTAVAGTPPVPGGYDKPPRERVSSNSSYLGVRGATQIREGLDGYFQVESGLNQDTGTATTTTSSSTGISGTFASRNSALGLRGDLGRLFLGNWETPYRMGFVALDPFGYTGIGGFSILGNGHTTNPNAGNLVSFGRRQSNSAQYWSPTLDGFRLKLAYSPNEERPATGNITTAMPAGYNPSLYSASLTYTAQQLYGYLGYERHKDYTSVGRADFGVNAGGSYSVGPAKFGVLYEQLHYRFGGAAQNVAELFNSYVVAGAVAAGATGDLRIASWGVFASYDVGPSGHLRAAYEHAADATGSALTPGARTGATKTTLGYGYTLSSQAEAYVVWTRINNHPNGTYDFTTNLIGTAPTGGGHPTGFGVGMSYVF